LNKKSILCKTEIQSGVQDALVVYIQGNDNSIIIIFQNIVEICVGTTGLADKYTRYNVQNIIKQNKSNYKEIKKLIFNIKIKNVIVIV